MAEQVNLKVELQSNLEKLVGATKGVKLDKGQEQRVEKYTKGAQLALDNGDLKTFQRNFNNLIKLFNDAAAATGKVSEEIKKLTARHSELSKEINQLQDKKTKLETHAPGGKLSKEGANAFYKESKDATKVVKANGIQATRDEIVTFQEELVKVLKQAKRNFQTMTTEDVELAAKNSGVNINTRSAAQAANRYVKAETAYEASIPKQLASTNQELATKEGEYANLTNELTRMTEAANTGADSIEKLYAEISKLGSITNDKITKELNKDKKEKADKTPAKKGDTSELPQVEKQAAGLGKVFKQFTLYNVALRAVKTALREAVQTVKELDKYLTEQAMVTGKTREETYALVGAYQDLAAQCGATTKEIAQVATEYMKQGKTVQDSLVLTEAAVKAAKVARVSVGDSVNYLTTALNGFQLEANEAMAVSDKFAALAASSATDYDELAIALSKVASQANLAGMSMDYTTALLTKGLETTREAPETMGTALKTIIARMRELGDYGETLDDGVDINNVETQLKYVDIALRDTSGELRSTEDVLDELGRKWDTLSKNQQAAVAKALAGTRQQARLIAMMEDYDRVIELQEISQRSAGATAAQAGVYLEGIEASMNKIQVAWEKIVMGLTESEVVIGALDFVAQLLDNIGAALETEWAFWTMMIPLGVAVISQMTLKWELQKKQNMAILKKEKSERDSLILQKQENIAKKKALLSTLQTLKAEKKTTKEEARQALLDKDKTNDAQAQATLAAITKEEMIDQTSLENEISSLKKEIKIEEKEVRDLKLEQGKTSLEQLSNTQGLFSVLGSVLGVLTPIFTIMQLINGAQLLFLTLKKKEPSAYAKSTAAASKEAATKSTGMFAGIVSAFSSMGVPGIIAGIALATVLVAALGVGIAAACGAFNVKESKSGAESTADNVNALSDSIYNLTKKSAELNKVSDAFEDIDNKVIKTKKDVEEMNSLLDSAADSMSTENEKDNKGNEVAGTSEKDKYLQIQTDEERLAFIKKAAADAEAEADNLRQQQLDYVNDLKNSDYREFQKLMTDTSNSDFLATQSAVRAIAYDNLYEQMDALKQTGKYSDEVLKDTEEFTSSLISSMSAIDALDYADSEEKMKALVDSIKDVQMELKDGKQGFASDVFLDEGKSINERIDAYRELEKALQNDATALKALQEAYSDWATLSSWDQEILNFIDATNLSVDKINELYESFEVLQKQGVDVTREQYKGMMDAALKDLDPTMSNLNEVLNEHFGEMLKNGGDFAENWETLLNQVGNIFAESILDMGQKMEKFENTVNGFYEKAMEWGEMSESERMEFISENAEMFTGEGGEKLLQAFENADYAEIEAMLGPQMEEQRKQRLAEVERTLAIEEARAEDKQNKAYIRELKRYKEHLEDTSNLYKASLEVRLEQQEKQINEYRDLLEKEQEALVESLEKRKEAYEKYFDDIAQEKEDQDYEQESEKLITNISKLASSTDADSKQKTLELEKQLKELEAERLQTLKERAREAILENMDNEIEEINDKFDKLLDSNQALLAAMQGDLENPTEFLSQLIGNKFTSGATKLELEDYIGNLESIYGGTLDGVDWDAIKEEVVEQLFLNVNGQDIYLNETDERAIYEAIKKALTAIGRR